MKIRYPNDMDIYQKISEMININGAEKNYNCTVSEIHGNEEYEVNKDVSDYDLTKDMEKLSYTFDPNR